MRLSFRIPFVVLTIAIVYFAGSGLVSRADETGQKSDPATKNIYAAAMRGRLDVVKKMVKDDPKLVNSMGSSGITALHYAALGNRPEVVEFLVKSGAKVDAVGRSGDTPLHMATFLGRGSLQAAKKLIELGADPNARQYAPQLLNLQKRMGLTVIDMAARNGHVEFVELLLEKGASIAENVRPLRNSALHWACVGGLSPQHRKDPKMKGNRRVIQLLVSKLKTTEIRGFRFQTPLHMACENGALDTVEFLLETYREIDVNARSAEKFTPLHLAVESKRPVVKPETRVAMVRLLLDHGAQLLPDRSGKSPLDLARKKGDKTILAAFNRPKPSKPTPRPPIDPTTNILAAIEMGRLDLVKATVKRDPKILHTKLAGDTLLHVAGTHNQAEIVEFLVQSGMKVDMRTSLGYTPLHSAALSYYGWDAAKKLIELGADSKARAYWQPGKTTQRKGISVLDRAVQLGHFGLVKLLLEKGAPIKEDTSIVFQSALHWACHPSLAKPYLDDPDHKGNRKVIRLLVSKLGTTDVRNFAEETPLHTAAVYGAADTVEFLLEEYPDIDLRAQAKFGDTPLHYAVRTNTDAKHEGHRQVIRLLVSKVGTEVKNAGEMTPLHRACRWGMVDTVRFLLDTYPKIGINAVASNGNTPLHEAVRRSFLPESKSRAAIVDLLLGHGAKILPNKKGSTPLDAARKYGDKTILEPFERKRPVAKAD